MLCSYNLYFEVFDNDELHSFKSTKSATFNYRKLTKEEYSQYLIEQDIKRFAIFSNKEKAEIREMESKKIPISKIKERYPNYQPNDEIEAIEFGNTGKSLREVKEVFPNYEPKK